MKKRILVLACLLLAAVLSGCGGRNMEEMYALPKRSREYGQVETVISTAMEGLDYSAPRSGQNQQTVQLADLDGDGQDEYLVFARGGIDKPLQVLIFRQLPDGNVRKMDTIGLTGLEFEQVEYVNFDDQPGCELVIGQSIGDQILRSVSVYTFANGEAELMLLNSYSKFVTCDLDADGKGELMVLRPGEEETQRGMAVLYSSSDGQIVRSVETELAADTGSIRRIVAGGLEDGTPAVFVASVVNEEFIVTDIFTVLDRRFTNIGVLDRENTAVGTLRNYYLYCEDIDGDGAIELPGIITMKPITREGSTKEQSLLRWFSMTAEGWPVDKMVTYHDYLGGWYIHLDSDWAGRVSVEENQTVFNFYVWDGSYTEATPLFTLYVFTGSNRDELSTNDGRFPLYRAEGIAYAAKLQAGAGDCGVTEESLNQSFHLIRSTAESQGNF